MTQEKQSGGGVILSLILVIAFVAIMIYLNRLWEAGADRLGDSLKANPVLDAVLGLLLMIVIFAFVARK